VELAGQSQSRHAHKAEVLKSESLAADYENERNFEHDKTRRLEVLFGLSAVAAVFSCACLYKKKQQNKNVSLASQDGPQTYNELNYTGTERTSSSDMV